MRTTIRLVLAVLTAIVLLHRAHELGVANGFPFAPGAPACSASARP
jgi:hypothetical protein